MSGAEHESTATEKWQPATSVPTSINSGVTGAHGRVYFASSATGNFNLQANYTTIAVRIRVRPTSNTTDRVIQVYDSVAANFQWTVRFHSDGSFSMNRGSTTGLEVSATGLWSINNWYTVEASVVIGNSGTWLVKFWNDAGTLLATLSGSGDTQNTGNATGDFVIFGSDLLDTYLDDLSIDLAGNVVGICQVETLYPNAAGDLADFTRGGSDTGANYSQVNETVKDTTSYNQSTGATQYDTYNIDARSVTGTPKAVQVNALGRSASGSVTFKLVLRIGGVTYEGSKTHTWTSTTADTNKFEVWSDNPATGNAWTDAEINSLQIGIKSTSSNVRLHQMVAEVLVKI